MKINVRQEKEADYKAVSDVIIAAFREVSYSNKREQFMVDRLRKSSSFIPELSLVAEDENGTIVGHILVTKLHIQNQDQVHEGLALAPLSIKPDYQQQGIGSKLIRESHSIAKELGYPFIVVLGHANYYPKFGYELTRTYNIEIPINVADENCMVIPLVENGLSGVSGQVIYANEFFE